LPPETVKPPPPPPTPQFHPPETYVAAPVLPEVVVDIPPAPKAITLPPAPPQAAPADAPLAAATRQGPPALGADARGAYLARLLTHLNAHKRYPESARMRHLEGVVSLRFTMDRMGRVLSYSIVKGSGAEILDAEARALIQRAQPLPPIPPGFGQDQLDLVVPVEFFLQ
jgi:protein TonB